MEPGFSSGTLRLQNDLSLTDASQLDYELSQAGVEGGTANDLVKIGGDLILDGVLNISTFGFGGQGDYTLMTYSGALADNGLAIGLIPAGYTPNQFIIDVSVPTKVILRVVHEPTCAADDIRCRFRMLERTPNCVARAVNSLSARWFINRLS